ncbi:MAG: hypothetical protein ACPHID_00600 [Thermoplasmatota archaeon]
MEKIDWIIAGVGVVALVATTLGVLYEEDLTGAQDITFPLDERTINVPQSTAFASAGTLTAPAGENATAAAMDVTVSFEGNAVAPQGGATVRVTVTDPAGNVLPAQTQTMTINNAANGGGGVDVVFSFDLDFGTVPADTTVDDVDDLDASNTWADGYTIDVSVTNPADPFTNVPNGATYSYAAAAAITESYYMHQVVVTDIQGGA